MQELNWVRAKEMSKIDKLIDTIFEDIFSNMVWNDVFSPYSFKLPGYERVTVHNSKRETTYKYSTTSGGCQCQIKKIVDFSPHQDTVTMHFLKINGTKVEAECLGEENLKKLTSFLGVIKEDLMSEIEVARLVFLEEKKKEETRASGQKEAKRKKQNDFIHKLFSGRE